jgi:hypothetical protein
MYPRILNTLELRTVALSWRVAMAVLFGVLLQEGNSPKGVQEPEAGFGKMVLAAVETFDLEAQSS